VCVCGGGRCVCGVYALVISRAPASWCGCWWGGAGSGAERWTCCCGIFVCVGVSECVVAVGCCDVFVIPALCCSVSECVVAVGCCCIAGVWV